MEWKKGRKKNLILGLGGWEKQLRSELRSRTVLVCNAVQRDRDWWKKRQSQAKYITYISSTEKKGEKLKVAIKGLLVGRICLVFLTWQLSTIRNFMQTTVSYYEYRRAMGMVEPQI